MIGSSRHEQADAIVKTVQGLLDEYKKGIEAHLDAAVARIGELEDTLAEFKRDASSIVPYVPYADDTSLRVELLRMFQSYDAALATLAADTAFEYARHGTTTRAREIVQAREEQAKQSGVSSLVSSPGLYGLSSLNAAVDAHAEGELKRYAEANAIRAEIKGETIAAASLVASDAEKLRKL